MRLEVSNIGMIKDADIELGDLTVISGENEKGKSTIGKILFSIGASIEYADKYYESIFYRELDLILMRLSRELSALKDADIRKRLPDFNNRFSMIVRKMRHNLKIEDKKFFDEILVDVSEEIEKVGRNKRINKYFDELKELVTQTKNYSEIERIILTSEKHFKKHFSHLRDVYSNECGYVKLGNENGSFQLKDSEDGIEMTMTESFPNDLNSVVYVNSPFVLDEYDEFLFWNDDFGSGVKTPEKYLINKLKSENNTSSDMKSIKINSVFDGDLKFDEKDGHFKLVRNHNDEVLKIGMNSVATGVKSFAILKMLSEKCTLNSRVVLFLDEPEVHLHPKWQIDYVKTLFEIAKNFGVKIVLTTHSPYFIKAIDLLGKKDNKDLKIKHYFAQEVDNKHSRMIDVTDNMSPIFDALYEPYRLFEDLQIELDMYDDEEDDA